MREISVLLLLTTKGNGALLQTCGSANGRGGRAGPEADDCPPSDLLGAKAVLQACRKVVKRPNSGKPADWLPGKVVTVDEFHMSRVSAAVNSPQSCEEQLDRSKPTRPEVSLEPAIQSASAGPHVVPLAGPGYPWGQLQMGGQGLQCSPQPPAYYGGAMASTGAVLVARLTSGSGPRQGVPSNGVPLAARPPTQGPGPAACSTVMCVLGNAEAAAYIRVCFMPTYIVPPSRRRWGQGSRYWPEHQTRITDNVAPGCRVDMP
ncbi:hypothetical protein HaLaN_05514 [Haematococcus lacustris]|uniref:Uncharacterized protein n=1 Tax=Haematococcus lacustris TaxID=44745 RepID=A0A699YTF1_HAELA|nr:hypothetical protein HaLaN_05514 [Haematococcus lacustris]